MEITVKQEESTLNYEYKIYDGGRLIYKAGANRTIVPRFRTIRLCDAKGEELCSLRQENLFEFILSSIPVINLFSQDCPFSLFIKGEKVGSFRRFIFRGSRRERVAGTINGQAFYFYMLSGNNFSIFCEDNQVALIKKEAVTFGDGDKYTVLFSSSLGTEIASLITVLIDIYWYTNDLEMSTIRWEKNIVFDGIDKENEWKPEE